MATELKPDANAPITPPGADLQPDSGAPITPPSGTMRRLGDAGLALAKGVIGVPEAAVGIADLATGGRVGKALENKDGGFGFRPKEAKEFLDTLKSPEQQAADRNVQDAKGFIPTLGAMVQNPSTIVGAGLESAPSMIGGAGVARGAMALAPRLGAIGAGAIGEGAVSAGQNAEQVRQEDPNGTLTAGQSAILAASGALTGGISFGAGRVANRLGLGDVNTMLAQGRTGVVGAEAAAAGANKGLVRKAGEGFLTEGALQELPQSAQEQVAQNLAQGKPWDEGVGAAAAQGLLVGGVTGAIAGPLEGGHRPPAPVTMPMTRSLGLPAPSTAGTTIEVGPDGGATTAAQRSAVESERVLAEQSNPQPRSVDGLLERGMLGQPYPVTDVVPKGPLASAIAAAPAGVPLVTPEPEPTTVQRAREYHEADETDRKLYDQIFGTDVQDVAAKGPSPMDSLLDENIQWDTPNVDVPTAMAAMGFTDEEIRDAIAANATRTTQGGASRSGTSQSSAGAARPPAGAPQNRNPAQESQVDSADAESNNRGKTPVLGVGGDQAAVPQSQESGVQKLRGARDSATPRVGEKLRGVPAGDGTEADASAHRGADGQREGLSAGQRRVGDAQGTGEQPTQPAATATQRANQTADDLGRGTGSQPEGAAIAGGARVEPGQGSEAGAGADRTQSRGDAGARGQGTAAGGVGQGSGPAAGSNQDSAGARVDARTGADTAGGQPAPKKIVEHVTGKGRTLRGVVRTDLNLQQAKAIDGGTFKKDGGFFIRERDFAKLDAFDAELAKLRNSASSAQSSTPAPTPAPAADGFKAARAAKQGATDGSNVLGAAGRGTEPAANAGAGGAVDRAADRNAVLAPVARADGADGAVRPDGRGGDGVAGGAGREDAGPVADRAQRADDGGVAGPGGVRIDAAPAPDDRVGPAGRAGGAAGNDLAANAGRPAGVAGPLYSQMRVAPESVEQLTKWASSQGFPSIVDDMHVTVGYSSAPVDASAVPLAPAATIGDSRARAVQPLGREGAVVLMLGAESSRTQELSKAHQNLRDAGASWDFEGYQPHITITYNGQGMDLSKVEPYRGPIALLGEERSPIESNRAAAEAPAPAPAAGTLSATFYDAIAAGKMPDNNLALKRMVSEFDGKAPTPARMKEAQEALEAAIVRVSREVVAQKEGQRTTFDVLRRLYDSQPALNVRTSTSVANQAYSTPAPLAFLASELAGVRPGMVVEEPTAGTGMLLIGATPSKAVVNELDPARAALLREQGFTVTEKDAAAEPLRRAGTVDAVVTNPPFGSIKDANGSTVKVRVDGYKLGQIDHLIAARALETLKDDGSATLILGANKVAGGQSNDDLVFLNWLYGHYNVTSHFEVNGDLYKRQGAGWPVRVITINGREQSARTAPPVGTIQRANTWEEVYDKFNDGLAAGRARPVASAGAGVVRPGAGEAGAGPVPADAGRQAAGAGGQQPGRGAPGAGNVAGAGAGTVSDRGGNAPRPVGTGFDVERLNAEPVQPSRMELSRDDRAQPAPAPAPAAGAAALTSEDNQFQAEYKPRSGRKDAGVLIPVNMQQPTQDALSRLEDAVGDIDQFATRELGYPSVEAMHEAFMGLQVDSVASAIYQIQQGKAVIIADQTGIGKGRQAAAVIRYAVKNNMVPVFVSVKPSLFTDMYGDLADIGTTDVQPFILNSDAWVSGPGGEKLFANRPTGHRRTLEQIRDTGELPEGSNALFMTYSQVNVENVQRGALTALAPRAVFVLDESHNAGGDSNTGKFIRGVLDVAPGVTYLSATYAKRPDNMPLYFKTDIGQAAADDEGLMQAMAAGGLPLQTVVSNNLVKAGQMFRRERSYAGVNIDAAVDSDNQVEHEAQSDAATEALRAIVDADRSFHEIYVKELDKQLRESGEKVLDIAGNQVQAGVQHTEFSSVVHNFVKQMLLGLKAQNAADRAITALKAGKKPIIAVENTMGSFLNEYAAANSIAQGQPLGKFDYRTVLSRALERSRVLVEQRPNGDKVKRSIALNDLDPATRQAYDRAQAVINGLQLNIPVSPIDWMRSQIQKAGYSVAEITGRNLSVDYSNPRQPVLSAIDQTEQRDKVATTRRFNAGELDAVILNVAGSTGISLHASEKFADKRKRSMIVAQPASDINIFMQMLGRIHRTGQVELPEYTLLSADLPTERRPTALLSKKMKSLNANTSSNTESATSVKTADMLNKYGDQVVGQYLADNYPLSRELGIDSPMGETGPMEDVARKATGRLALQPIRVQQAFYEEVEGQYNALLDYLNKTNQNDLEPRTFDFDARETRQEVLFEGVDKNSPFGDDAIYGEYSIKAQGKPMSPGEIKTLIAENLAGKTADAHTQALIEPLTAQYQAYRASLDEAQHEPADAVMRMGRQFMIDHAIGKTFRVDINGDEFNAVVTNIRSAHKAGGNPFSLSKIQVTIAVNGALRSVTVPATQFNRIETSAIARGNIDALFREGPPNQRETAKIITGNLLAAYGELKGVRGTIVSFTKQDGTTEQGILLPKAFDFTKNTRGDYRLHTGADALKFLQQSEDGDIGRFGIMSRDSVVRVLPNQDGIKVQVPKSKLRGGKYFLDKGLIAELGDFVTSGNNMVASTTDPAKATAALDLLMKKQALYALPSMAEEAKRITGAGGAMLSVDAAMSPQADVETTPTSSIEGIPTRPASATHQAKLKVLVERLAKKYGSAFDPASVEAVEPNAVPGVLGQSLQAVRSTASRLFGHDVVFVRFNDGNPLFNGAASTFVGNTVFIRVDAARPHMAVLGHELLHNLRTVDPRLYRVLNQRLEKLYTSGAKGDYFEKIRAAYAKKGMGVPREWDEELTADIVGDHFMDPKFWQDLGAQGEPGQFRILVNAILKFIERVRNLMRGAKPFGTDQYLTDLDAARAAVVQAIQQFSADQLANPGRRPVPAARSTRYSVDEGGDTLLSVASDPTRLMQTARDGVATFLNTPGKVNWWHKTVGTPYNLAQRSPEFKRVYDRVQDFIKDVSAYATEAADLAPRILPQLNTLADLKNKKPLSAEDTKAVSRATFEGTLTWARDESGRPIKMADLEARYADFDAEQKARLMMRRGVLAENELKRWQALPIDSYEGAVRNRFDATVLKAGVVWKPAELKSMFGFNDKQVSLYQEGRAALDRSLTDLALSDMVRFAGKDGEPIARMVMDSGDVVAGSELMRDHLLAIGQADPARSQVLMDTANKVIEKADRATDLMERGYAPLSRFGTYSLDVVDSKGDRAYFGLFESRLERAAMAKKMAAEFPGATITQGTVSQESHKLFAGVSPETLELFGEMLGLEAQGDSASNQAFQQYLKLAKGNRSAMKRLIERKGIAGFDEDFGRVLAGFITSNARQTSGNLNTGAIQQAAADIDQRKGEVKDAAMKLAGYVSNPQEEAGGFRGLLFAQYIGGSVASAMVNLTQPLQTTLPYLSQFGGVAKAAKNVRRAAADAARGGATGDASLDKALKMADERGITLPQEIHQLQGQAMGNAQLQAGDGTKAGEAKAILNNSLSRLQLGWGKLFSVAESYNRRLTFIAAYRTAQDQNIANPFAFAEKAVAETQFVANKGNRPRWARGAVGATLFTFKSYSVNYIELLGRMATAGEPGSPERIAGQKAAALALATLFLMGGAGGLPFAEDLGDLIDGLMQRLGFSFNTKQKRQDFLEGLFGKAGADFVEKGVSGIAGVPVDLSGRMGMGNLIPGTGFFPKKNDYGRDTAELFGPAGDFVKRALTGAGQVVEGKPTDAVFSLAPKAVTNLRQAADMATTGMYRDARGKKVLDTNGWEALAKGIGFQPASVAQVQDATFTQQNLIGLNRLESSDITDRWAQGIALKDPDMVQKAQADLKAWNERNPESPIRPRLSDIHRKARVLLQDKETRIANTAPKALRAGVREQLQNDMQR